MLSALMQGAAIQDGRMCCPTQSLLKENDWQIKGAVSKHMDWEMTYET